MSSDNNENAHIDPLSSLLSPPSAKITSPAIHAFFTPRQQRRVLSSITPNQSRVHLLSPEDSPSLARSSKRLRIDSSPIPASFDTRVRSSTCQTEETVSEGKAPAEEEEEEEEEEEQELALQKPPRQRIRPNTRIRTLMRSMGGLDLGMRGYGVGPRGLHCADWKHEVMGYYSRPEDEHRINFDDHTLSNLPFSAEASNQSSLVALACESGMVILTDTAKDEEPGFSQKFLTIVAHENAIFDMSWSHDDLQLATASGDQSGRVFDVRTQTPLYYLRGHQNTLKQINFNPYNPSILATSARDGLLNIWDLRIAGTTEVDEKNRDMTGLRPVQTIDCSIGSGPGKSVSVTSAIWFSEHRVASATEGTAAIKLWDLKNSRTIRTRAGRSTRGKHPLPVETSGLPPHHERKNHRHFGITSLTVSPDNQRIYGVCKDNNVYAYSANHLHQGPIHAYHSPQLHVSTFYVKSSISRDGRTLATGSSDSVVTIFPTDEKYFDSRLYGNSFLTDTATGIEPSDMKVGRGAVLKGTNTNEVTDVTWTMDGDLVSISDDWTARCWRKGEKGLEAEELRGAGDKEGKRWMCGWAEDGYGKDNE